MLMPTGSRIGLSMAGGRRESPYFNGAGSARCAPCRWTAGYPARAARDRPFRG